MKRFFFLLITTVCFTSMVLAQDVAFFSKVSGDVKVTTASGTTKKATTSVKLAEGDKVVAGANGGATIMYYTGKEVVLAANKSHLVRKKEEENSFLSSLYSSLSSMMWGETSNTSMAGATRAWAGDANRMITASYPAETKVMEEEPVFKWVDHRKTAGTDYVVTIKSEITDFSYDIPVSGVREVVYPKTAPKLSVDEKYVWTVKDAKGADVSPAAKFSLLHPDEKATLDEDLNEVRKVCNSDITNPQWYLLSSALYRDYGLMKQAEAAIQSLISLKPDMAQAHIMLATLYKETGRLEEAKASEEAARKLSEGAK